MESISFDRAVQFYDRTRALSERAMDEVVSLLADELNGRVPCLEVGIGTGRIGLPLRDAGIDLVGIDLSAKMLAALTAKSSPPPPVAAADATTLPFRDGSFGAALACHVLHLIPAWRIALREMTRVLRGGGLVLIDLGGWGGGDWERIERRFVEVAGILNPRPGATDPAEVDAAMASVGATVRLLPEVTDERAYSYAELLDRIEKGVYSFTWATDEANRVRAARAVRTWAESELGPLDEPRLQEWTVRWRAYDLPG